MPLERRSAERFRVHATTRVFWLDAPIGCTARLVNISDTGVAVESARPLEYGAKVYIQLRRFPFSGVAHVRRCAARRIGYFAALEFQNPPRLNPTTG